jgi:hypothetical protein
VTDVLPVDCSADGEEAQLTTRWQDCKLFYFSFGRVVIVGSPKREVA